MSSNTAGWTGEASYIFELDGRVEHVLDVLKVSNPIIMLMSLSMTAPIFVSGWPNILGDPANAMELSTTEWRGVDMPQGSDKVYLYSEEDATVELKIRTFVGWGMTQDKIAEWIEDYASELEGPEGPQGPAGPPNSLSVGTVTTLGATAAPTASVSGTAPDQVINFGLPRAQALQYKTAAVPAIGILGGTTDVTVTWDTAFADANYVTLPFFEMSNIGILGSVSVALKPGTKTATGTTFTVRSSAILNAGALTVGVVAFKP